MVSGFSDAFNEHEALEKKRVIQETWGHMSPKPNSVYPCELVFAFTDCGDYVLIRTAFTGLDDSPWLTDDLMDFICEKAKERGTVYRFEGVYKVSKEGTGTFKGRTKKVRV